MNVCNRALGKFDINLMHNYPDQKQYKIKSSNDIV